MWAWLFLPLAWKFFTHTHSVCSMHVSHLYTYTHTDPHPSSALSLLYLHISTSIGYTCNLATEMSEDPPLPALTAGPNIQSNCVKAPTRANQTFLIAGSCALALHLFDSSHRQKQARVCNVHTDLATYTIGKTLRNHSIGWPVHGSYNIKSYINQELEKCMTLMKCAMC